MSIRDYLSKEQIDKILEVIRSQCEQAARNDVNKRYRIEDSLYERLKKGRKAHDVTGDIYVALFYPENMIDGLEIVDVNNGYYTQPELQNDDVLIHIYHRTNKLDSELVKNRVAGQKPFFCIRYDCDKLYRLKSIDAIHVATHTKEVLYEFPTIIRAVG